MFATQFSLSTISPRNKHLIALALVVVVFAVAGVLIWWFSKPDEKGPKSTQTDDTSGPDSTTTGPTTTGPTTEPPTSDETKGETWFKSLGSVGGPIFAVFGSILILTFIVAVIYYARSGRAPGNLQLREQLGKLVGKDYSDERLETILLQTMNSTDPKVQDLRKRLFQKHKDFTNLFSSFTNKEVDVMDFMEKSLSEIRQETANAFDKSKKDVYDEFQKYHGDYQFTPAEMRAKAFHLGSSKGIEL